MLNSGIVGAEQIVELTPPIAEVFEAHAVHVPLCATLTVVDDADRWIQVTRGELNVAYPHARDPAASAAELGLPSWATLSLLDWEENSYATFEFDEHLPAADVARIADTLLIKLAGAPADYAPDIEVFEIPP
jgi:hypothetical protein